MSQKIYKKLLDIQSELHAPKNQRNNFGNYNYRSCEDIVEAVKPLAKKYEATVVVSDTIKEVGGRVYIQALASITCTEDGSMIGVTGWAREAESRKGMDDSQLTGSTSSYARKYALNGLFAIDDTKDADSMKPAEKELSFKDKMAKAKDAVGEQYFLECLNGYQYDKVSEVKKEDEEAILADLRNHLKGDK